jgi:hypothetical protein
MLTRIFLLLAVLASVHCARPAARGAIPALAGEPETVRIWSPEELRETITPASSNLVTYHLTGASWAGAHPVLVNRDFDFSLAMGMDGIGPAVAAGNRKKANDEVAALLATMPALETREMLAAAIRAHAGEEGSFWSSRMEVALFGLLYGGTRSGSNTRLQTVLEVFRADPATAPLRFIVVSDARPLDGDTGWVAANGTALREELRAATGELVGMADRWHPIAGASTPGEGEVVECPVGDGEKLPLIALERLPARAIGTTERIPHTVIACPVPE